MKLFDAMADATGLTPRDTAVIVLARAAEIGDSYCAIAWGKRLTDWADPQTLSAHSPPHSAPGQTGHSPKNSTRPYAPP